MPAVLSARTPRRGGDSGGGVREEHRLGQASLHGATGGPVGKTSDLKDVRT